MIKAFGLEDRQSALLPRMPKIPAKKTCGWRVLMLFRPDHLYRDWYGELAGDWRRSWMVVQGSLTLGQLTSFMMF